MDSMETVTKESESSIRLDFLNIKNERFYCCSALALFIIILFCNLWHHEMWRDELQSWLIALSSNSISDLFSHIYYEGHPPLWFLLLYFLKFLFNTPYVLQILAFILGTGSAYLILFCSPFPILIRLLIPFGYFFLYEYGTISREYSLGVFLLLCTASIIKNYHKRILSISLLLTALANTSAYGAILAIFIAVLLALFIRNDFKNEPSLVSIPFLKKTLASLLIFVGGLWVAIATMQSGPYCTYSVRMINKFLNPELIYPRIVDAFGSMWRVFFPLFALDRVPFWNTNILMMKNTYFGIPQPELMFFFSLLVATASTYTLKPNRTLVISHLLGTFSLLFFTYFVSLLAIRHVGHIYLWFIFCLWLSYNFSEGKTESKWCHNFLVGLFTVHIIAGVYASSMEFIYPFSHAEAAAKYIRTNFSNAVLVAGKPGYISSSISGFLNKEIYYQNGNRYGSFIRWDTKRRIINNSLSINFISKSIKQGKQVLWIGYDPKIKLQEIYRLYSVQHLRDFALPSIDPSEKYFLFLIQRKSH